MDNFCEHCVEIQHIYHHLVPYQMVKSEEALQSMHQWFNASPSSSSERCHRHLHYYLDQLESFVSNDGTVLHQGKVTLADAKLFNLLFDKGFDDAATTRIALRSYPKLSRIIDNFASIPGVKQWIESRSPSIF